MDALITQEPARSLSAPQNSGRLHETQALEQRVPGVFISDVQGNEFTPDLRYRGFAASPLQGTPQGLAVYMQGVRVNEAFGKEMPLRMQRCFTRNGFPRGRLEHCSTDSMVHPELIGRIVSVIVL
jgi:hypothetical protein